jgi:hypothetical protein
MKKFFTVFFVTLGIIFFIIILFVTYLFIFDPFNIKPLLFGSNSAPYTTTIKTTTTNTNSDNNATTTPEDNSFTLSEVQKAALKSFGVDPASVPSTLTVEQSTCFRAKLGDQRYAEVKAGAVPNALEFFNAKGCI